MSLRYKGTIVSKNYKLYRHLETIDEFCRYTVTEKSIFWKHRIYPASFFWNWRLTDVIREIEYKNFWLIDKI